MQAVHGSNIGKSRSGYLRQALTFRRGMALAGLLGLTGASLVWARNEAAKESALQSALKLQMAKG